MIDAGLILKSEALKTIQLPLSGFSRLNCFKLFILDIGLLAAMANLPPDIILHGHELFSTWHGAFVENHTAQQLISSQQKKLYYWRSESYKAEIDFIIAYNSNVYPFEVKAGINPKSKSLISYNQKFNPCLMIRSNLLNLKKDGQYLNIPLYAVDFFPV